jgi:hypothetical protein
MQMKKGGLSTIIVTLILILVSLVAVGIIWVVVRNVIQTGTEGVGLSQFSLSAKILDVSIDNSSNNVSLTVKRNAGKGNLTGISFVFSSDGNIEVITRNISLKELEQMNFIFHLNMSVSDLTSVSIVPLIKQDEKQITGIALDKYNLGNSKNYILSQTCIPTNCSALGYICGTWNNGTCSGTLSCGNCSGGQICNATGRCVASCIPSTCASSGYQCGSGYANGTCAGNLNCGNCTSYGTGYSCNASGRCVASSTWQFDWNARTDRYGKPAGYFDITPFPINETTTSYSIKNDEYPNGKTYYVGTKYYVDRNIGIDSGNCQNSNNPCSTINYAITQAGNGNVAILIKAGIYDLTTSLTVGSGINDTNRWILSGWGQDRPIISGKLFGDNIIKSSSKSYLTVQRLKIQDSYYEGIGFSDGAYINLIDLWVYNTTNRVPIAGDGNIHLHQINNAYLMHLTSEHTYDHCIKIGDNDNNAIVEWSIVKECGYWLGISNVTDGTACGFDFPSDSPQEPINLILKYSIAHDVLFSCSQVRRQNNYSLHHNEFYNCPNLDAVTGERSHITPQGMVNIHQTSYGRFYDNLVRSGPDREGIADSSCTDCLSVGLGLSQSSSVQTSYIYNNLFWDIARPLFVYGYSGDGLIQHYEILGNSFYGNSNNTLVSISSGSVTLGEDSVSFQNNIIYQNGTNVNSRAVDLDSDIIRSYNLYYAPYSTIGTTLGTSEINANPLFETIPSGTYSFGEGHLISNSPAINSGTSLSSLFAIDLDGVSRPQSSAWDIGAYEYV